MSHTLSRSHLVPWVLLLSIAVRVTVGEQPPSEAPATAVTPEASLEKLQRAIEAETGLSPETKSALLEALHGLARGAAGVVTEPQGAAPTGDMAARKAASRGAEAPSGSREPGAWEKVVESLTLYGDLRLRHESSFLLDDRLDRHRERLRLRFGANYSISPEVLVGARLTTGSLDDPRSPHQTLGDGNRKLSLSLDRVFVTYQPSWLEGSTLTAGKFAHAFAQNPVYGELVWDADVQPEGIAGGYRIKGLGPLETLELWAGEYLLLEQAAAAEAAATVVQASGTFNLGGGAHVMGAVGYYAYSDVTPGGSTRILDLNNGNASVDRNGDGKADHFRSRFGILDSIAAVSGTAYSVPWTVSVEHIFNTEAASADDQGWAAGISAGSTKKKGDWRLYYQWQLVEQDAVFTPVSQDDFLFGSNHKSHLFGVNYQLAAPVGLHIWGLVSRLDRTSSSSTSDSDRYQWRVRLDLNIRF